MIPRRDISLYNGLFKHIKKYIFNLKNKEDYFLKFKKSLESYFDSGEFFLIGSGRQSFHLIFDSVKFDAGDEIIIPNYYLNVLIPIIKSKGLVPVFCDIDKNTLSNNLEDTLNKITKDTKFIILPHIYGLCTEVEKFIKEVKNINEDILIIEDCAHSFGSNYNDKSLGTFGDFSLFSFDYIKTLNLLGGGALLVNNKKFLKEIKNNYLNYKKSSKSYVLFRIFYYYFSLIVLKTPLFSFLKLFLRFNITKKIIKKVHNSYSDNWKRNKLSYFQSFLGHHQLKLFDEKQSKIKFNLEKYKKYTNDKIIDQLIKGFNSSYSYYFLFLIAKKDSYHIEDFFYKNKIDIGIKDDLMDLCDMRDDLKNSEEVFNNIFQVPLHFNLKEKEIKKVSNCLNDLKNKGWL